jgi:hypothetical protein
MEKVHSMGGRWNRWELKRGKIFRAYYGKLTYTQMNICNI